MHEITDRFGNKAHFRVCTRHSPFDLYFKQLLTTKTTTRLLRLSNSVTVHTNESQTHSNCCTTTDVICEATSQTKQIFNTVTVKCNIEFIKCSVIWTGDVNILMFRWPRRWHLIPRYRWHNKFYCQPQKRTRQLCCLYAGIIWSCDLESFIITRCFKTTHGVFTDKRT